MLPDTNTLLRDARELRTRTMTLLTLLFKFAVPGAQVLPRVRFAALAALLSLLFVSPPAAADVFTISDVRVDVTAGDAAQAKVLAIEQGQIEAFRRLVARLAPAGSDSLLPAFTGSDVTRMMEGMTFENERTAPTRYIAQLTIRFLPEYVRSVFYQYNVPFTEEQSPEVLFLPVWKVAGGYALWDDDNPWRDAWLGIDPQNSLTPMLIPIGDLTDVSTIAADEAASGNAVKLEALTLRYGINHALVAVAETDSVGNITIVLRGDTGFGFLDVVRTYQSSGMEIDVATLGAAQYIQGLLEEAWKNQRAEVTVPTELLNAITVAIPFDSLAEWNTIRSRIEQTYGVGSVEIDSLSARGGIVRISYEGALQQLSDELRIQGLVLSEVSGTWVIQPYF